MMRRVFVAVAAFAGAVSGSTFAHGSLVGNSVEVLEFYPDMSTQDGSTVGPLTIAPGGTDFGDIGFSLVDVAVGGSTITLDAQSAYTPIPAAFNGFDIRDLSLGTTISGVSLDGSSGFLPPSFLTFSAHDVYVNLEDVPLNPASPIIVDVTTSGIPEPAAWVMMLVGFAALGGVARGELQRGGRLSMLGSRAASRPIAGRKAQTR
jgi:hypothetical protein